MGSKPVLCRTIGGGGGGGGNVGRVHVMLVCYLQKHMHANNVALYIIIYTSAASYTGNTKRTTPEAAILLK